MSRSSHQNEAFSSQTIKKKTCLNLSKCWQSQTDAKTLLACLCMYALNTKRFLYTAIIICLTTNGCHMLKDIFSIRKSVKETVINRMSTSINRYSILTELCHQVVKWLQWSHFYFHIVSIVTGGYHFPYTDRKLWILFHIS